MLAIFCGLGYLITGVIRTPRTQGRTCRELAQRIPSHRFVTLVSRSLPVGELGVRQHIVGIVEPEVVYIDNGVIISHLGLPVLLVLLEHINLCTFCGLIANNMLILHRHDIREVIGAEAFQRRSVDGQLSDDGRVISLQRRDDTIYLIGNGVVIRLNGDESRVMYATRLNEYRLRLVRFLILDSQRTRTERHSYLEVTFGLIFEAQLLVEFHDTNHRKQILRIQHLAFEEDVVCTNTVTLRMNDYLARLTDRTGDDVDTLFCLTLLKYHLRTSRRTERQ